MYKQWSDKWSAALRSGKYKQGVGLLRNAKDEYCCLGVLSEICGIPAIETNEAFYQYDGEFAILSNSVMMITGIKSSRGYLKGKPDLCVINDLRKSFDEIADIIDANYDEL